MLSLLLKVLKPKSRGIAEAGVLVVILLYSFNQHDQLKTERARLAAAETSLRNPKVVEVVKTVKVAGPTRFIYRLREQPDGTRETETEEYAYGWSEQVSSDRSATPLSLSALDAQPIAKTDRWLAGIDINVVSPKELDSYTFYAGYSFRNRLDLLAGVSEEDGIKPHVMGVVRF